MSIPSLEDLTFKLRRVAIQAGHATLRHYDDVDGDGMVKAEIKGDGSPVTAADAAAEAVILPALKLLTPDIPVVSEEAVAGGDIPEIAGDAFWLVDPLDGTKEFIKRNGEFTVNIALVIGGAPALGVVYAPALGKLYAGHGPGTAVVWTATHGTSSISVRTPPEAGLTVVASRSHGDADDTDAFLAKYRVAERISCGSSLKFCAVASGEADLYPRFGPTCHWDTAAAHAVLAAAGGRVETVDGAPLTYHPKPGFLNPYFIAYGKVE